MSNISTDWANSILAHIFGKTPYTAPAHIYVALSTTLPTDVGGNMTPPSGNGYARLQTSPSDWGTAAGRQIANGLLVEFAEASGDWGTPSYFALYDSLTGGVFLGWGPITTPKPIGNGDKAKFAIGTLVVKFNPSA